MVLSANVLFLLGSISVSNHVMVCLMHLPDLGARLFDQGTSHPVCARNSGFSDVSMLRLDSSRAWYQEHGAGTRMGMLQVAASQSLEPNVAGSFFIWFRPHRLVF